MYVSGNVPFWGQHVLFVEREEHLAEPPIGEGPDDLIFGPPLLEPAVDEVEHARVEVDRSGVPEELIPALGGFDVAVGACGDDGASDWWTILRNKRVRLWA